MKRLILITGVVAVLISPVSAQADPQVSSADVCNHYFPLNNPAYVVATAPVTITGPVEFVCVAAPNLTIDLNGVTAADVEVDVYSDADNTTVIGDHNGHMTTVLIKSDESDCWAGVTCSSHAPDGTVVEGGPEMDNVENAGDAWGCIRESLPCDGTGGVGRATLVGGGDADQLYFHMNADFPNAPFGLQTVTGGMGGDVLGAICTTSDGRTGAPCPTAADSPSSAVFNSVLRAGRGPDHIRDRVRGSTVYGGKGYDVCKVARKVTTHGCEVVRHF